MGNLTLVQEIMLIAACWPLLVWSIIFIDWMMC